MNLGRLLTILLLGFAVMLTSVAVVHAKYSARKHFVELQKLRLQRDELDVEWGGCCWNRALGPPSIG